MSASEKSATNKSLISHQFISELPVERLLYEPHPKIYTRRIKGFYQRLRRYTGIPLLLAYLLIPWLSIDGRPAMLFDLSAQKFHVLWMTFWPQDAVFLSWLLIIAAFLLFTTTVLVGRVWCGFSCPQTVWTMMFIWVEDKCEGDRNQRIKLDRQPWSLNKLLKKTLKHGVWLSISLITGLTFVSYFYAVQDLLIDLVTLAAPLVAYFWVSFFVVCTYMNAGWLREQVCKHMCPYARFQSVMYDNHTLLVSYDSARGEPRVSQNAEQPRGDCVDCLWCVQVCPVDIDIRDGLQYECIDCGLCVDACDAVMEKIDKPRGLIAFTSHYAQHTGIQRFIRPRFVGYLLAVVCMLGLFAFSLASRELVSVDVIRDRGNQLYQQVEGGIENVYTVKINNHSGESQLFNITVEGELPFQLKGRSQHWVVADEVYVLALRVRLDDAAFKAANTTNSEISFSIQAYFDPSLKAEQDSRFLGPYSLELL